jgi:hypothetical protein
MLLLVGDDQHVGPWGAGPARQCPAVIYRHDERVDSVDLTTPGVDCAGKALLPRSAEAQITTNMFTSTVSRPRSSEAQSCNPLSVAQDSVVKVLDLSADALCIWSCSPRRR